MNSKKKVTGTARGTIFSSKSTQKFYSPIFCRLMLYLCKLFLFTEYVIYTRSNILCFQSRHCDALISFPSVRKMRKTEQLSAEQQVLLRTLWIDQNRQKEKLEYKTNYWKDTMLMFWNNFLEYSFREKYLNDRFLFLVLNFFSLCVCD